MELAFAGLHQVCAPLLDRLERLPGPQHDALCTAFGLSAGAVPDRFLVGLAALGLFSVAAEERPLVCVVDDVQWLDRASQQALGFVARRLLAEPVALVFAAREYGDEEALSRLPELVVEGLAAHDAQQLLSSVLRGPIDERVRDRIVAETRGNPLALMELPRARTLAELAGGFGLPDAGALVGGIEDSFRRAARRTAGRGAATVAGRGGRARRRAVARVARGEPRRHEPGDRRPAVHQPQHGRLSPAQGVSQARSQVPPSARTACAPRRRTCRTSGASELKIEPSATPR